ncbi:hypothetical protein EJ06DRAFT_581391 [Trichodelitschia bisporula]|uniref:Mediator of RNA polymerase II transcription subunit 16 n=1 Tax=Trichodelitschia bisporula TaxID=703511 RepID=A0A6G1HYR8_9PEZI|nr:hypothetical protein EJ06DRAFT_581391 [Trichodelitschia bisporula]
MEDDDQYMKDLFGDPEQVAITAPPTVKGLNQRLDELLASGCCQKIAWSGFGCIAAVGESGRSVELYTLIRNQKTGSWNLSKPGTLQWPSEMEPPHVAHITWSHMGNDLTVVDDSGRMLIYSNGFALGQMMPVRIPTMSEPVGEMNALVGLHWLPVFPHTQKSAIYWSATRTDEKWNYKMSHHLSPGPYNPVDGKSALICLNRSGVLRLVYQQRDNTWLETTEELEEPPVGVGNSFTHASFAPDVDNSLLLATYDASNLLRLYRININWNQEPDPMDGHQVSASPSLHFTPLLVEDACFTGNTNSVGNGLDEPVSYNLTHLEVVPVSPELAGRIPTHPMIIGIFTAVPPPSGLVLDPAHQHQQPTSVIRQWHFLKGFQNRLHSCFDQLAIKKRPTSSVDPRPGFRLKRQPDVVLHSAVLSILPTRSSTMFIISLSDGSIHFRHRDTMEVVEADDNENEVHTMPQSGFVFPNADPCLHLAFSPNALAVAIRKPDGTVKIEMMEYSPRSLKDIQLGDPKLGPAATILSLQHGSACMQYKTTDDLLAILPPNPSEAFTHTFLTQAISCLNTNFDWLSDESQKQLQHLYRLQSLFKCLSLQSTFGLTDKRGPRKLASRLAWITINLRLISLSVSMSIRTNENLRAEMAITLIGLVKWSLDFLIYLLQEILRLHYEIKLQEREGNPGMEKDGVWIQNYLETHSSPAILVLLASIPRILLRMMCRPLRHGKVHAQNNFKTCLNPEQRMAFQKLLSIYVSPVPITALEQYLSDVDTQVKNAYAAAGFSAAQRADAERDMFTAARIPPVLLPVVTSMLTTKLTELSKHMDAGKIYLHDVAWLNLTDDRKTKAFHEKQIIDVIRKFPLAAKIKLRRCPRCASVMEDFGLQGPGPNSQAWLWQSHKCCVCFGAWTVLEPAV